MWQKTKHGLYKQFVFNNFQEALNFINQASDIAIRNNHHFKLENDYKTVQLWLATHEQTETITDLDYKMSEEIDNILNGNPDLKNSTKDNLSKVGIYSKVKLYADGGSRGNPGPSSSGFVVLDLNDKILYDEGIYLGITTNNQAEYTALKLGLEKCLEMGSREVKVFMDSLLVINQMKGIFKVRNREIWPIHDAIMNLVKKFKKVEFQHVPREYNKLADAAVNRALDQELAKQSN